VIEKALDRFRTWCSGNGYAVKAEAPSEVAGAEGNREIFLHLEPVAP
jgi:predicted rRNA methylase YqxC with S4 and FtsJ domains